MDASTKPRVEVRSLTGGPYSRAGQLWSPEFSEVPEEILSDAARMDELDKDVHIEIKEDGRYVSGPRVGASDGTAETLERATRANAELRAQLADSLAEADALRAELAAQLAIADEAKKALAAPQAATTPAKTDDAPPAAPPPAKGDETKASKSSSKG